MATTPDRSLSTPQSAPRARGVARKRMIDRVRVAQRHIAERGGTLLHAARPRHGAPVRAASRRGAVPTGWTAIASIGHPTAALMACRARWPPLGCAPMAAPAWAADRRALRDPRTVRPTGARVIDAHEGGSMRTRSLGLALFAGLTL